MKEFLSPFQEELTDFLAMRKKTVGAETYAGDCRILGSFDRFFTSYAELSQTTTDKHIREWNRRWFWDADPADDSKRQTSPTDFLK